MPLTIVTLRARYSNFGLAHKLLECTKPKMEDLKRLYRRAQLAEKWEEG